MFAYPGQEDMLRDIKREVAYTRHEIGRDAFAPRVMAAMAAVGCLVAALLPKETSP